MTISPETYDLIIVGATPCGAAAAIRARRAGLSCLIIKPEPTLPDRDGFDWLGPAGIELCQECGLNAATTGAAEFTGLRLHSWDLKSNARITEPDLTGWIIERTAFGQACLQAAQKEQAEVLLDVSPQTLTLGEECAALAFQDGPEVRGRILLIADGLNSHTAALARMQTAGQVEGVALCIQAMVETGTAETGLDVIIGARRAPQTITLLRAGGRTCVTLVTRDLTSPVESQLSEFLNAAQSAGLIPTSISEKPSQFLIPAGLALDMETLVGKRSLLIGEAAGFMAAFSSELLYPAMKSGWIAAEAADRALQAPVLQDELQSFSPAWRAELAEYLRLPNTDLALLMPLVFNNEQMSARVARAFLLGQSF